MLHEICFGKKVILISATPINNYTSDIENLITLFQSKHNSTIIPNIKNLEGFFRNLRGKLKKLDRGTPEYTAQMRENSEEIRDKILRTIMIRRVRNEIIEYYSDDLKKQKLTFPKLGTPEQFVYTFDKKTDEVFSKTIRVIKTFKYARYLPLTYLKNPTNEQNQQMTAQRNVAGFMKGILVKRLESSFFAFRKTLERFIQSYARFIDMCREGDVYISKKVDVYDLLDNGDDEKLMEYVEADKAQHFLFSEFREDFMTALVSDLKVLKGLYEDWSVINEDPKLDLFKLEMAERPELINNKLIIFTESTETAAYIGDELSSVYGDSVAVFSGVNRTSIMKYDIETSFNPEHKGRGDDKYRILITTDVLAEGVNLHRSNVVINYDLPWNPTRIMQRVGRINRVGTEFDRIFVFNFFPTAQSDEHLTLRERIIEKIQMFHDALGEDFKYLSDAEEVSSHKLYTDLMADMDEGEGMNPELQYLTEIRSIRDNDELFFEKIKKLPLKAKSGKHSKFIVNDATITFLRKGMLKMFFMTEAGKTSALTFIDAIRLMKSSKEENRINIENDFYNHLKCNKTAFDEKLIEEDVLEIKTAAITGNDQKVLKLLKALSKCRKFTDTQELQLQKLMELWEEGDIPANITKNILKATKNQNNELQIFNEIINLIPDSYFIGRNQTNYVPIGTKQVVLSCWLKNKETE